MVRWSDSACNFIGGVWKGLPEKMVSEQRPAKNTNHWLFRGRVFRTEETVQNEFLFYSVK